ncbi:MAG: hypothetical protein HY784_05120 [Chloroflexi bacterium]|nr:hypothetical protein [Chloroflexota bacterium]
MSAGYCYASEREFSAAEVHALIEQVVAAEGYAQVEELTKATLSRLTPGLSLGLQGRAFSERAEVRWRRVNPVADAFEVLALAERNLTLSGKWSLTEFEEAREGKQVLWGAWRKEKEGWAEARIPRVQHYPVAGSEARPLAVLITREYRQQGITRLSHFLKVEPISGKEGE